ncbi:MAG: tRNA (adenine(22)-N(1))-methyltransferase [Oscillospiraceae bacterium]
MAEKVLSLQPRLRRLAELVPQGACLADVGTDHGYIPVHLLQAGRIQSAIASDIGREPLEHARRTAAEYGLAERIVFRLCDGLAGFAPEEADCILIAGMGGETIAAILEGAPWLRQGGHTLLLQPMTRQELLRTWLTEHGFCIRQEHLVFDKGTLYNIFCAAAGGAQPLTEAERFGGVRLEQDPLYGEYLTWQVRKLLQAASGLRRSKDGAAREKAEAMERTAALLQEKRGEWLDAQGM